MQKVNKLWSLLAVAVFMGGCGVSASNPTGNFRITTATLPSAQISAPYAAAVQADGGTPPYSWIVRKGNWPQGIILNSSTGTVAGSPVQKGRFSITLGATDSSTPPKTTTTTLSVTVNSTQVAITTTSLPSGAENVAYSTTLAAGNGDAPYAWSVASGNLPNGVTLQSSGTLSGTPTQAGTFSFTAEVTDSTNSTATASLSLTIAAPSSPVINSLSPSSGPTAGGAVVTISGANFASGASVTFGGVAASSVTVSSASQIQAVAPTHVAGTVGVLVSENGQNSGSANFTYNALTPAVSSVSPSSGPTAGGTTVTINGSNFLAGALVLFGTAPATNVSIVSATQIQATTPSNAAGSATVSVQDPGNLGSSLSGGFTYTASQSGAPTITGVSPSSGTPGTQVTITGTNFASADVVSFGSTNATPTAFISATQLTAVVPSVSAGSYNVTVTDPDPASTTLSNAFTVTAPPPSSSLLSGCVVTGVQPKSTSSVTGCSSTWPPSGWTLQWADGAETGSVTSGVVLNSGANVCTAQHHTGAYSYCADQTGDDSIMAAYYALPAGYHSVYISAWEYRDTQALFANSDDDFMSVQAVGPGGTCSVSAQSQAPNSSYGSTTNQQYWPTHAYAGSNCTTEYFWYNGPIWTPAPTVNAGTWVQTEMLYTPNTTAAGGISQGPPYPPASCASPGQTGCGNGTLEIWRNGVLVLNCQNCDLNDGSYNIMTGSGATAVAGGNITSFNGSESTRCTVWAANGGGTCPGSQPGTGAPPPYYRYEDDIIVLTN
jgi:IPT/TIG domain/Putative Ig domain